MYKKPYLLFLKYILVWLLHDDVCNKPFSNFHKRCLSQTWLFLKGTATVWSNKEKKRKKVKRKLSCWCVVSALHFMSQCLWWKCSKSTENSYKALHTLAIPEKLSYGSQLFILCPRVCGESAASLGRKWPLHSISAKPCAHWQSLKNWAVDALCQRFVSCPSVLVPESVVKVQQVYRDNGHCIQSLQSPSYTGNPWKNSAVGVSYLYPRVCREASLQRKWPLHPIPTKPFAHWQSLKTKKTELWVYGVSSSFYVPESVVKVQEVYGENGHCIQSLQSPLHTGNP